MKRCIITPTGILTVSKPGFDVTTTAAANLLFDGTANMYRRRATFILSVTGNGSRVSTSVNHGLGVTPLVLYSIQRDAFRSCIGDYNVWTSATEVGFGTAGNLINGAVVYAICHLLTEPV